MQHLEAYSPSWWDEAACRGIGNFHFFGEDERQCSLKRARIICGGCKAIKSCLTHALENKEEYGIWAGTSARAREKLIVLIEQGLDVETVVKMTLSNPRFRWAQYGG